MSKGEERAKHIGLLVFFSLIHLSLNCCTNIWGRWFRAHWPSRQKTLCKQMLILIYICTPSLGVMCDLLTGNCLVLVSHSISATELCLVMPFCLGAHLTGIYTSAKCIDYMSALICKHIALTWKKHKALGMGASLWIFQTAGVCSGGHLRSHTGPAAQGWEETSFPSAGRGFASLWKSYCILKYNMAVSFCAFKLFLKAVFSLTDCCI